MLWQTTGVHKVKGIIAIPKIIKTFQYQISHQLLDKIIQDSLPSLEQYFLVFTGGEVGRREKTKQQQQQNPSLFNNCLAAKMHIHK